jgi:hypothetical protein
MSCYEKGLNNCECGREPWEQYKYCDKMALINKPHPVETCCDKTLREYQERLVGHVKYYAENASGLEHDLIEIIYRG